MNSAEYIFELKKSGTCKIKGWGSLINIQKKSKVSLKNLLLNIDKRLTENNLTIREIELIIG